MDGIRLFSPKWWISSLLTAFITMLMIYLVKMLAEKSQISFLTQVTEGAYK